MNLCRRKWNKFKMRMNESRDGAGFCRGVADASHCRNRSQPTNCGTNEFSSGGSSADLTATIATLVPTPLGNDTAFTTNNQLHVLTRDTVGQDGQKA
mmetsp:Transcript_12621/g.30140  ORF Transcript_12621/g.30140 Transcript_12621/m.30140 type:complete len:97 (-) Transcript_12621:315-605(-)